MRYESVHSLVLRAAERFPNRRAVECPQGTLTYAALERRSRQIAQELYTSGAGGGRVIPVLAEDRREAIAAVLGILRIGGVFALLECAAPRLRLEGILGEIEPHYAIVGTGIPTPVEKLVGDLVPSGRLIHAAVETKDPVPERHDHPPRVHQPDPNDPYYVFFTSGSTGRPKGVVGRAESLSHYVGWLAGLLDARPGRRVSQLASLAFDAMVRDVFVPLCTGGTVCVPPAEIRISPHELGRWIEDSGIDLVNCVPTVFRGIANAALIDELEFTTLRCIAMAGESVSPADVGRWFDRYGERIQLLNLYGATETTVTRTYHFITRADADRTSVPIGQPMPGTRVDILDDRGHPCPQGAVGEIHIRSPYLALGYHRHPEATRAVFLPAGPDGDTGDVTYRTGDFGRLAPDGLLEFLGRRDQQVKIGGIRVELGEVEEALRRHPAVGDVAVTVDDQGEVPRLCAFIQAAAPSVGTREWESRQLRQHLANYLPDSLIPRLFVPVSELPRTISGKIDRRALPAPSPALESPVREHTAPRSWTEKALAEIWSGLLPEQTFGVHDDFFELGGYSLLVMQLLSRVRGELGAPIHLRDFLVSPTIESLAGQVDRALESQ
ncbi:amino acid adenylation domain-containing protein [Spinactinospora alkalitolerans]|uniref:Amino acid adenylation domain-containing protein n=1 Tax=Spinactinospora alkalitolerans TaxID=687207 RepID=A0A852TU93_9ACTN|nr:non-ribosomal peptide synthetase [Spinactinospora alkalitolerans]NYE48006.1 amino acid adenylation domain-containing protein [Spinactinospora alkalitolerans]